jgi:hypothetical protein|nr:MAG TPA: hypothetical protein [Bacteriophage sp.]
MNKYIIHCITAWCGVYEDYSALAKCEEDLDDLAQDLAYSLFIENDGWTDIAEEQGYDPDTMTEEEWDILYETTDEAEYYWYNIELVDESDQEQLEEWKEYNLVYQPKE